MFALLMIFHLEFDIIMMLNLIKKAINLLDREYIEVPFFPTSRPKFVYQ